MTVEPREQVALLSQLSISLSLPAFLTISEFLVCCVCIYYPWPVTDSFSQMWLCYVVRWWNVHIQHKQLQVTTCNKKRTNNYTRIVFVYTNRSVLLLMAIVSPPRRLSPSPHPGCLSLLLQKMDCMGQPLRGCYYNSSYIHLRSLGFPKWFGNSWNTRQLISRQHYTAASS